MASVLFLAPADLGETVLATGALAHVLREGDALAVSAPIEARALFRAVKGVAWFAPRPRLLHGLIAAAQGKRYDTIIDARGDFAARFIPARRRVALSPAPIMRHRVEDWADAVGAERALAPKVWLDEAARRAADAIAPTGGLLVLAPGGASESKRWPPDRFAAVARRLVSGPLLGAHIIVLGAAARDADITAAIVRSLDADGIGAQDAGVGVDLLAAAALMERATLCIGNDNALTHIAAAVGAPTLTLFGPTDERVRAPWGPRTRTLRGRSFQEFAAPAALDAGAAMGDLSIDAVEAAALELLHAGGLR